MNGRFAVEDAKGVQISTELRQGAVFYR